jgi:hypothetical protein
MSPLHQLALMTKIRKLVTFDESFISEVISKTRIVNCLATILSFKEDDVEEIYYIQLEALWIIITLASTSN